MSKRVMWAGVAAVFALVLTSGAWADDEPEDDPAAGASETVEEPSPLADLREEHLAEETDPVDPLEYLKSFRDWVALHENAPPRTSSDHVLYDVWTAALKPRASRMTRRIDTLMKRDYWLPETGMPERVNPKYWGRFVRELAGLASELNGAWKQYDNPKIREGLSVRRRSYYGYAGYAYPVSSWRGALVRRQSVGISYGPVEMYSYWNLMNRYRSGWDWRIRTCYDCEARRREVQKKVAERVAERDRLLETTRDTLAQQMLSLQLLAAAMQATEEYALRAALEELPEGHVLRRPAEDLLITLRDARLAAERYSGPSSVEYGQLLRSWMKAYNAGMALLEKEAAGEDDGG